MIQKLIDDSQKNVSGVVPVETLQGELHGRGTQVGIIPLPSGLCHLRGRHGSTIRRMRKASFAWTGCGSGSPDYLKRTPDPPAAD